MRVGVTASMESDDSRATGAQTTILFTEGTGGTGKWWSPSNRPWWT